MSNSGKTEDIPKSGHVNEVCKEWLVREDGALAYKLQSQEINEFYKGNRFRNAVVREDFPTALHEQIKEKENAEKQSEAYRRQLMEQELYDKRIAKEIADKLERDLQEQRQHEIEESELIAQQMQEIYVNLPPPVPQNGQHLLNNPPPRPTKPQTSYRNSNPNAAQGHQATGGGLVVVSEEPTAVNIQAHTPQKSQMKLNRFQISHNTQENLPVNTHKQASYRYTNPSIDSIQAIDTAASHLFSSPTSSNHKQQSQSPLKTNIHPPMNHRTVAVDEIVGYSDLADSIRHYDINSIDLIDSTRHNSTTSPTAKVHHLRSASNDNLLRTDKKFQKLSPEKYDQIVGNMNGAAGPSVAAGISAEQHVQLHVDDIEIYVDPCNYASLKEIGLPLEEIKEMCKKLKQEQKDELLARCLQEIEATQTLNQEERDRKQAIEAQDKELARILQEKERAKAKRAKEKARLRKTQLQQSSTSNGNGLHCGPLFPTPQDCLSGLRTSSCVSAKQVNHREETTNVLDMEAYSNPIDVLQQQQRSPNGTLTNGSFNRDRPLKQPTPMPIRDDDIYTLPVDSCCPTQRPQSLNISPERDLPTSLPMSESYAFESHDVLSRQDKSARLGQSKGGSLGQNTSPTPPYMPIQGTRRSITSEDRKKKTKDKCTHQ